MQQEKGHTNKEKLKSRFFAKRIWKTKYIPLVMSKSGIFDFFWPNKSVFLKLFLLAVLQNQNKIKKAVSHFICGTVLGLF